MCISCARSFIILSVINPVHCLVYVQCDHYRRGIISGSSCKALCEQKTLTMQRCMSTSSTHQVQLSNRTYCQTNAALTVASLVDITRVFFIFLLFYMKVYSGLWKERPVVIKCGIEDPVKVDGIPDSALQHELSLFDKPTRGTSMDEFKAMLHSFLKVGQQMTFPFKYYTVL